MATKRTASGFDQVLYFSSGKRKRIGFILEFAPTFMMKHFQLSKATQPRNPGLVKESRSVPGFAAIIARTLFPYSFEAMTFTIDSHLFGMRG